MKTVRFTEVVAAGGRPAVHLTWTQPESDRTLQTAAKQARVLTVHRQTRGGKKDFGTVGIETGRDAQFLIFPKSIRQFWGRHVVAIRYELLAEGLAETGPTPKIQKPARPPPASALTRKQTAKPAPPAVPVAPAPVPEPEKPPKPKHGERDPIKREIQSALKELANGKITAATRRLQAIVGR